MRNMEDPKVISAKKEKKTCEFIGATGENANCINILMRKWGVR